MSVIIGDWVFEHVSYDGEADVLYLALDHPRPGVGEETPEGHILRYDENGEFYGVTLIGIREAQEEDRPITVTLPRKERVDTTELEPVFA